MESMAEITSHRARREQEARKKEAIDRPNISSVAVPLLSIRCHPCATLLLRQIACAKSPAPNRLRLKLPPFCHPAAKAYAL